MTGNEILWSITLGVFANGISAVLGWIITTWIIKDSKAAPPSEYSGRSLADIVDYYVEQQRLAERRRQLARYPQEQVYRIEHRITVENRSSSSDDNAWGALIGIAVLLLVLGTFWTKFKVPLFWTTVIGVAFGWVSSFYFVEVLKKIPEPHRIEDKLLSWGSMAVWVLGVLSLYLGVYQPLYPGTVGQDDFSLMMVGGLQLVGTIGVYIAIAVTAFLQFVAGSVYRKALRRGLPNGLEVLVWEHRWYGIAIASFSLALGFMFASGLWFQIGG